MLASDAPSVLAAGAAVDARRWSLDLLVRLTRLRTRCARKLLAALCAGVVAYCDSASLAPAAFARAWHNVYFLLEAMEALLASEQAAPASRVAVRDAAAATGGSPHPLLQCEQAMAVWERWQRRVRLFASPLLSAMAFRVACQSGLAPTTTLAAGSDSA